MPTVDDDPGSLWPTKHTDRIHDEKYDQQAKFLKLVEDTRTLDRQRGLLSHPTPNLALLPALLSQVPLVHKKDISALTAYILGIIESWMIGVRT